MAGSKRRPRNWQWLGRLLWLALPLIIAGGPMAYGQQQISPLNLYNPPNPYGDPTAAPPGQSALQQSVVLRSRPDYDPLGIHAGGFLIYPKLELGERYDDNIRATQHNRLDDFATTIAPSVAVESTWSRHALGLQAFGVFEEFADHSSENTSEYGVNLTGRLDMTEQDFLSGFSSYSHQVQPRSEPDDTGNRKPSAFDHYIAQSSGLRFRGVLTHAGHSYGTDDPAAVARIAAIERDAAVTAAAAIRDAGIPCEIVSVGSTPTVLHAEHLAGVTEARAGIYMFWDLAQLSRNMCREDEIAVSVLASVIGHNRRGPALILDAGALALSKDIGANKHLPGAGYGYLCDVQTLARHGALAVDVVHQEHGTVTIPDESWFERLPVGSLVRVLPNHACLTCAGYDAYHVLRGGGLADRWDRVNGW